MTAADREAVARRQRAQEIALWRWTLVEPAMDPALTARQRGRIVRDLAAREHDGPSGRKVPMSQRTIDRWVVARRDGGFEALVPELRQCAPRTMESNLASHRPTSEVFSSNPRAADGAGTSEA